MPRGIPFAGWIDGLHAVIQDDYGYEEGEFAVYPEHWAPLYREGLTPADAFRRALDAADEARKEADRLQAENWRRIQEQDRQALARARSAVDDGENGR